MRFYLYYFEFMRNIFFFLLLILSFTSKAQAKFEVLRKQLVDNKTYEYVYAFENDHAVFRTFKEKTGLIDSSGNVIIKPNYEYLASLKDRNDIYEAGITINKKFKRGFIDLQNNVKIPFEYEDTFYLGNNLVRISKGNKAGVINIENKTILPVKYDYIMNDNGILFVQTNNTVDLFDSTGKQITNFKAADIEYFKFKRSIVTLQNKNTLIIDPLGNIVLNSIKDHSIERIIAPDTYIIRNRNTNKKGIIKTSGRYEIECKYDDIQLSDSLYIVKQNKKEGLVTKRDSILKPLIYDDLYGAFHKDSISYKNQYHAHKDDLKGIINPFLQKEIIPVSYKYIEQFSGYYITTNPENKNGLFSADGQVIIPEDYDFYNAAQHKIFAVKNSKNYLLTVEKNSFKETEILTGEFIKDKSSLSGFSKSKYQIFKEKNKFGVISNQNNIVIPAEYDAITEIYGTGEFIVKKNSKYGIVNSNNQILLELKYDSFQVIKESVRFNIKNQKTPKHYPVKYPFSPQ